MPTTFTSIRSGSSGNCLLLRGSRTSLLIDCGLKTKWETQALLSTFPVAAVIFTHGHGDHIGRYPIKVLKERKIPLFAHAKCLPHITQRLQGIKAHFKLFSDDPFQLGEFQFQAIRLTHYPGITTYGFIITQDQQKISILTDFHAWPKRLVKEARNSRFIYLESNYDYDLLLKNYNPNARYHMRNETAAQLLCDIRQASDFPPSAVMLGHLSEDRNRKTLALRAVRKEFQKRRAPLDFRLHVAPRYSPLSVPVPEMHS
ncbi:MAG: MBL fold metallo-hydrolase [Elusimicrobiota bacterium]